MPIATRNQTQARNGALRTRNARDNATGGESSSIDIEAEMLPDQEMVDNEEQDAEDDDNVQEEIQPEIFPPPGLKEISSLASWTVSTAKPGNGVAALRSPDTSLFWQSDGPQPHLISIHFFKLVSIVHMRIYLDFESDESYTPTKIQFLAGMSEHDLQEFAEMSFEQPTGWIDVDFTNVGPPLPNDDDSDRENQDSEQAINWSKRPVLRAFLVQIKILENHQNGKDTHLRAVQLFARDEMTDVRTTNKAKANTKLPTRLATRVKTRQAETNNIKLASWMAEPDLR